MPMRTDACITSRHHSAWVRVCGIERRAYVWKRQPQCSRVLHADLRCQRTLGAAPKPISVPGRTGSFWRAGASDDDPKLLQARIFCNCEPGGCVLGVADQRYRKSKRHEQRGTSAAHLDLLLRVSSKTNARRGCCSSPGTIDPVNMPFKRSIG